MEKLNLKKEERGRLVEEQKALMAKETLDATEETRMSSLNDEIENISKTIETLERAARNTTFAPIAKASSKEERDMDKFSVSKFVRAAANEGNGLDGIEKEMMQEGANEARNAGIRSANGGIFLPAEYLNHRAKKRAAIAVGSSGTPGEAWGGVATSVAPWVAALWVQSYMEKLGIVPTTGLVGDQKRLRSGKATFTFKTETGTAADGNPDNDYYTLTPHRLPGYIDITKQALIEWPGADGWVMDQINNGIRAALQKSIVNGGGTEDLTGLLGISSIPQYYAGGAGTTSGTNPDGAALVYADYVNMLTGINAANADPDMVKFLINSSVLGKSLQVVAFANIQAPLIKDGLVQNLGRPYVVSNHVPSNLSKGASGAVLSGMIAGDFSGVDLAQWGGIEIFADPYTQATAGTTRFHVNSYWDMNVKQYGMFTRMKDIVTT